MTLFARVLDETRRGILGFAKIRRDKRSVRLWLRTARTARLTAISALLVGFFVVPTVCDVISRVLFPPKVSDVFLGMGRRERPHRAFETTRDVLEIAYWAGAAGVTGWLLLVHAGRVRATTEKSLSLAPTAFASNRGGGRYRIEKELGRGGMGVVYQAFDMTLERTVALKTLPPELARDEALAVRFVNEARVLARLSHAHIVPIYDLGRDPDLLWMAMELLEGGSLADRVSAHGRLSVADIRSLCRQAALAMGYAHRQGIVHRDFKPHNVLLTSDGIPKVADFGLARLMASPHLTQAGMVLGSPTFMSPEQAGGREVDGRTDVYALGATLFWLCAGRGPFEGDARVVIVKHLTEPPPRLSDLAPETPAALSELVARMLAKDPAQRPATMEEIAEALA